MCALDNKILIKLKAGTILKLTPKRDDDDDDNWSILSLLPLQIEAVLFNFVFSFLYLYFIMFALDHLHCYLLFSLLPTFTVNLIFFSLSLSLCFLIFGHRGNSLFEKLQTCRHPHTPEETRKLFYVAKFVKRKKITTQI